MYNKLFSFYLLFGTEIHYICFTYFTVEKGIQFIIYDKNFDHGLVTLNNNVLLKSMRDGTSVLLKKYQQAQISCANLRELTKLLIND